MTLFSFIFPILAAALWRAGQHLEPHNRPYPYPNTMSQLNAATSIAIIGGLITALQSTREKLAEARAALAPTQADLAAAVAEDEEVEAKLLEAKALLDAITAEDSPPSDPVPVDPVPVDPAPPVDPVPVDPAPPVEDGQKPADG